MGLAGGLRGAGGGEERSTNSLAAGVVPLCVTASAALGFGLSMSYVMNHVAGRINALH